MHGKNMLDNAQYLLFNLFLFFSFTLSEISGIQIQVFLHVRISGII